MARDIVVNYPGQKHSHDRGREHEHGRGRGRDPGMFTKVLQFIARFWTEADKRVGGNMKYWR